MANFNKVILAGNLTRDPEMDYMPSSQTAKTKFGLAVNRKRKSQDGQVHESTCFVDCVAFGKQAETINQYMTKGQPILVEGRLHFSQWQDKQTGANRSKLEVVVEGFQFLGAPTESQGRPAAPPSQYQPAGGPPPSDMPEDCPF
jgi:single-strand DNA-binding protein